MCPDDDSCSATQTTASTSNGTSSHNFSMPSSRSYQPEEGSEVGDDSSLLSSTIFPPRDNHTRRRQRRVSDQSNRLLEIPMASSSNKAALDTACTEYTTIGGMDFVTVTVTKDSPKKSVGLTVGQKKGTGRFFISSIRVGGLFSRTGLEVEMTITHVNDTDLEMR